MPMTAAATTNQPLKPSPRRAASFDAQSSPVLDLAHLRRFTGTNRALEREVLELFAGQAPSLLRDMQLAASEKQWRDAAHTLKGSAYAIGANAVAGTAAEAEASRAEPGRWPEILARLGSDLEDALAAICIAVDAGG